MNKISRVSSYFLIAVLLLGVFFIATPRAAKAATTLSLVNVLDSTNNFFFTSNTKHVGDTFVINITVNGAVNVGTWQALITWDASLLNFSSFALPSDNILAYSSPISANTPGSGNIACGATLGPGFTTGFTGSGTCGVLTLKIIQAVGLPPGLPAMVSCALSFSLGQPIYSDTYLLDPSLGTLAFTPVNGAYQYSFVYPTKYPKLYLSPASIDMSTMGNGSTFDVNVFVDNLDAGWEVTGFQFSIMWNTTLIAPAGTGFDDGTFLETFQYAPSGVVYATDLNTHDRVPPLTPIDPGYNYSIVGELMLPDFAPPYIGSYHSPPSFPTTDACVAASGPRTAGPGLLGTFHFQAIYATLAPALAMSSIDFIAEDVLVLNHYNTEISYTLGTGVPYTAPQTTLGLAIDVYTQYPSPFGGQGGNKSSDSFGPQQDVTLSALVTYNGYPVQQKLVALELWHQSPTTLYLIYREGTTNADGIATVDIGRLPWPCNNPAGEIFGWWYVNATVEVAGKTIVDNLRFWVWWPVQVVSVEPKFTSVTHAQKPSPEIATMDFRMIYLTYHQQSQPLLTTGTVYDELGFFIGSAATFRADIWSIIPDVQPLLYPTTLGPTNEAIVTTVNSFAYNVQPYYNGTQFHPAIWTWDFSIPLKSNAVVGIGTVFGNAFTDWPYNAGTPYCPEVTNTLVFRINKP